MNIAYIRVSIVEQNEARQLEGLKKFNIDKIFLWHLSQNEVIRFSELLKLLPGISNKRYFN